MNTKFNLKNRIALRRLVALMTGLSLFLFVFSACFKPTQPLTAAELLDLGEKYLLEQDYAQALVQFTKLIDIEPMNPRGYTGAAEAYIGLGQPEQAEAILRQGLAVLPENAELMALLPRAIEKTEPDAETDASAELLSSLTPEQLALLDSLESAALSMDSQAVEALFYSSEFDALFDTQALFDAALANGFDETVANDAEIVYRKNAETICRVSVRQEHMLHYRFECWVGTAEQGVYYRAGIDDFIDFEPRDIIYNRASEIYDIDYVIKAEYSGGLLDGSYSASLGDLLTMTGTTADGLFGNTHWIYEDGREVSQEFENVYLSSQLQNGTSYGVNWVSGEYENGLIQVVSEETDDLRGTSYFTDGYRIRSEIWHFSGDYEETDYPPEGTQWEAIPPQTLQAVQYPAE